MAQKEESLTVVAPGLIPSLPTEIALRRISKMHVQETSPYFDPQGPEWVKAYFPQNRHREHSQEHASAESFDEERHSALRKILVQLQRTSTPPQSPSEPTILYAEPKAKPKLRTFTPSRPTLDAPDDAPKPKGHYMERVVGTVVSIEETSAKMIRSEEICIDWLCGWVSSLSQKLIEHIRDASEIFKQRESWSILAKVASGILGAISIVFGVSLVATPAGGMLVGGLLIASGLLSIVNLIFEETKVWDRVADKIAGDDKKLRDQLKCWIPAGVGMLSMLVGSVGSIGALFMEAFNRIKQMLLAGKTVTDIAKHIAKMAEGVATSESLKSQAETEHMQTQIDLTDSNLKGVIDTLKQIGGTVRRSFSSAHHSLELYARAAQMRDIQG